MNLTQLVLDKIEQLGETKAAEYFGKSRQTIYAWKKTSKIPGEAIQKVFDEASLTPPPEQALSEPPAGDVPTEETIPVEVLQQQVQRRQNLPIWQADVDARLDRLEDFARMMTDPDGGRISSLVRPQSVGQQSVPPPVPELPSPTPPAPPSVEVHASTPALPQNFGPNWNQPYKK